MNTLTNTQLAINVLEKMAKEVKRDNPTWTKTQIATHLNGGSYSGWMYSMIILMLNDIDLEEV